MKKTILMAAVALLASGTAAIADNASGVWGGFSATATDGVVYMPDGKGGSAAVYSDTISTTTNSVPGSYAGIGGYYSGVSASGSTASGTATDPKTFNTIGAAGANTGTGNGVAGYGAALNPSGAVDLSGQSVSSAESSLIGNNVTAKTLGMNAANAMLIGGAPTSTADVTSSGVNSAVASNGTTFSGLLSYTANAGSANVAQSFVNVAAPTYSSYGSM